MQVTLDGKVITTDAQKWRDIIGRVARACEAGHVAGECIFEVVGHDVEANAGGLGGFDFFIADFPEFGTGAKEVEEEGHHQGEDGRGDKDLEESESGRFNHNREPGQARDRAIADWPEGRGSGSDRVKGHREHGGGYK